MKCLKCQVEMEQIGSWAWCPKCHETYSPADIDELIQMEENEVA